MKPADNLREIIPGLWSWSTLHEEWKLDFSSCAWRSNEGLVLVDPVELSTASLAQLERAAGKPTAILLTSQNHERAADAFRKRYGIKVHVHRDAVPGIEITPDEFFCDEAVVPGGLKVIHVPGVSPSECAFFTEPNGGVLLSGDVLMNTAEGLALLPADYCQNAVQNRESAKKFLKLNFQTLTVGHGNPVHPQAREQVAKVLS